MSGNMDEFRRHLKQSAEKVSEWPEADQSLLGWKPRHSSEERTMQVCPKCHARTVEWDCRAKKFLCLNRACCEAFEALPTVVEQIPDETRAMTAEQLAELRKLLADGLKDADGSKEGISYVYAYGHLRATVVHVILELDNRQATA